MPDETDEVNKETTENNKTGETTTTTTTTTETNVNSEKEEIKTYKCITLSAFGGSKHIRLDTNEVKPIGNNEIAIDVQACGINFLDIMTRQGLIDQTMKPPFILGSECTGIISEIGEKVTTYKSSKSDQCITYLNDESNPPNNANFLPHCSQSSSSSSSSSITGILKFHLSPNQTIELLICANKSAVKQCISASLVDPTHTLIDNNDHHHNTNTTTVLFNRMNNGHVKEYLTELNTMPSSLPVNCSSLSSSSSSSASSSSSSSSALSYRSTNSMLISTSSSTLSSMNSGKENQKSYTNLTTIYPKDYIFHTHDINLLQSNTMEYNDRSQDELQAARTILSLAHGSNTDDMVLNMGQIMMELDENTSKVNNLCGIRNTPYTNTTTTTTTTSSSSSTLTDMNNTMMGLKSQSDELCENSRWLSSKREDENTIEKSLPPSVSSSSSSSSASTSTSMEGHSVESSTSSSSSISNVNASYSNSMMIMQDKILNDMKNNVSSDNNIITTTTTTTTTTTNTSTIPLLNRPTDNLVAIQPTKLTTTHHCTTTTATTDIVWNPISSSQNNSINSNNNNNNNNNTNNSNNNNNNVLQRKIRPPPKKRLSTNYTRSNSSRSLTDNANSTTKLDNNTNQMKTSSPSTSIGCEQLTVPQPVKQIINNLSSNCSSNSTEQIDTLLPSFPTTSGIGLLPTPIQFTNVVYGNPSFISSQPTTPLTSYLSNTDSISHQSNPMNGFTMVFPSPRPITPTPTPTPPTLTPSTLHGSQPSPSFFILPQLMVLPRFIGSYIPMITAPEPYPSIINPISSSSNHLSETRSSSTTTTFMTSSLVTPIPTIQPEYSTNHPSSSSSLSSSVKTIILQPPSSMPIFNTDINTTIGQLSDDHQLKSINSSNNNTNTHDDLKETNGSDSNSLLTHQSDTALNPIKDKLLLPPIGISAAISPNYSKKYDNAKCVWSNSIGFNTTKPIPIRPVPEVSRIKSNNSLSTTVQSKSMQDHHTGHTGVGIGGGQMNSDQRMLPILVSSHELTTTNNLTKLTPTTTTTACLVSSSTSTITSNNINYSHCSSSTPTSTSTSSSSSSLSGHFVSPNKNVNNEIMPIDTKQSQQSIHQNKLVTILPANTNHHHHQHPHDHQDQDHPLEKIKCQSRSISNMHHQHKKRINFITMHNNHYHHKKKYLTNLLNSQRSTISTRGKYRCQDNNNVLHTSKSYQHQHHQHQHHLKKHWHTHSTTTNRLYICQNCDVSFKTRGNLNKHMKSRCHHDRFLQDSGVNQVSLSSDNSSFNPVINQEFEHQSNDVVVPHNLTIDNNNNSNNNNKSTFKDRQPYSKSSTISSTSSLSCKTRKSTGAINNRTISSGGGGGGNKRNQVKSSMCTNLPGIIPRSTSTSSISTSSSSSVAAAATTTTSPSSSSSSLSGTMSLKFCTTQSNNTCTHTMDSCSRIPAPNVNAVNLSQDLPMNLSAKPQEPIALIRYIVEPTIYTKMNGIQSNHHSDPMMMMIGGDHQPNANNFVSSTEVIVQTAVEAARHLAIDNSNLKQTDDKCSHHSASDSKIFERIISTAGNLSDHVQQQLITTTTTDTQTANFNISNSEEIQYSSSKELLSTSTPSCCHQENNGNDENKSNSLLSSGGSGGDGSFTTCTEEDDYSSSSENVNNDNMKQNNCKSLHNSMNISNNNNISKKSESDNTTTTTTTTTTQSNHHSIVNKSHTYVNKDPRPYKCNMCHVGFRVSGHLCKHYRSKSHMSNILQMAQLSTSTIERILQSHMNNLQLINPDTGELSMRILEKLIPPCELSTVSSIIDSGTNNGRHS
ncbi:unnamed protein product [Schistosoma turkestanicum]|nr:unnamed protein product [Schistosoma turkestanicum]